MTAINIPHTKEVTAKELRQALLDLNHAIERVFVRAGGPEYSELMTAQGQARLILKRTTAQPDRVNDELADFVRKVASLEVPGPALHEETLLAIRDEANAVRENFLKE